jgi:hypothetical protein
MNDEIGVTSGGEELLRLAAEGGGQVTKQDGRVLAEMVDLTYQSLSTHVFYHRQEGR